MQAEYPPQFRCPLLDYNVSFIESAHELGLDAGIAQILDYIRELTTVITAPMLDSREEVVEPQKIQARAACKFFRIELRFLLLTQRRDTPRSNFITTILQLRSANNH